MVKIIQINQTGKAHRIDGMACEDALFVNTSPFVCCLADGVSNSTYGGLGAKQLVDSIGSYLIRDQVVAHYAQMDAQSIRQDFVDMISQVTAHLCQQYPHAKPNDFASTFMACFSYQNVLTIIHAGDGAIFALHNTKKDVDPVILSYPDDNQFDQVYHAAHKDTIWRLRVLRVRLSDLKGLILGTDGFTNAYLNPSYQGFDSESLLDAFDVNSQQELSELVKNVHLREHQITDDISAIVVKLNEEAEKPTTKKRNISLDMPEAANKSSVPREASTKTSGKKKKRIKATFFAYLLAIFVFVSMLGIHFYIFTSLNSKLDQLSRQVQSQQEQIEEMENITRQNQTKIDELLEINNPN